MKIIDKVVPPPIPPTVYTVELTEAELQIIMFLTGKVTGSDIKSVKLCNDLFFAIEREGIKKMPELKMEHESTIYIRYV